MNKRRFRWTVRILFLLVLIWVLWANTAPEITEYTLSDPQVPAAFDGFRILQISDLHNDSFGEDNEKLLRMIGDARPDIIVLTGDLVDSRRTDIDVAIRFAEGAAQLAPTYYVCGNHEARLSEYDDLVAGLEAAGVTVLENEIATVERSGQTITILGAADPSRAAVFPAGGEREILSNTLAAFDWEGYSILLSHKPDFFAEYVASGVNLVFSGHAHGGQFRLPFIGGLFAPGQGWLPEYDAGTFTEGNTTMVVSRGLGASSFPLRFNNRPEIVVVTLEST